MSRINQIQIRYTPIEDRILLRLNTEDASEFRFWITRSYAIILADSLLELLRSSEEIQQQQENVQKAMISFQHEDALSKADFAKTFQAKPKNLPLGDVPVLLSRFAVKQTADGNPMLCMYPEQGQGIDLALQQQLLHSISKLFADALVESEWGVNFSLSDNNHVHKETEKPLFLN